MANTIDADLLIDTLSKRVVTTLGPALAPLKAFTSDFSTDLYTQTKAVQVTVVTGGSTTQTNPSNFETSGDSTTDNVAVTMNHYSNSFHITSAQLNQQFRIEQLADKNLQALANKIVDVAMTPIDATNFTNESAATAQASITTAILQTAWGTIADSPVKNVLLDGVAFAKFLPTSHDSFKPGAGAYGFDGFFLNTRWTGAVAGTYGFVCGPDAIAQASGIPAVSPAVQKLLMGSQIVSIPNLGLSVQLNVWGSVGTRTVWASYDVMYGAAYGKQGAKSGYRIKSA